MAAEPYVLAIDNDDSFVHILADQFRCCGCTVDVFRRNWPEHEAVATIRRQPPDLLLLSPGPGTPEDATLCLALLAEFAGVVPVFGVCLGHQCIVHHFGGRVGTASEIMHGKPALIQHSQSGLFQGVENPIQVGRYHSLIAHSVPSSLVVDATYGEQVMAVRHRHRPVWGVQFHPESVLTPSGPRLIHNLLNELEVRHAA